MSTACTKCSPGTVSSEDNDFCLNCEAGKYSNDDNTVCVQCPIGTISNQETKMMMTMVMVMLIITWGIAQGALLMSRHVKSRV